MPLLLWRQCESVHVVAGLDLVPLLVRRRLVQRAGAVPDLALQALALLTAAVHHEAQVTLGQGTTFTVRQDTVVGKTAAEVK